MCTDHFYPDDIISPEGLYKKHIKPEAVPHAGGLISATEAIIHKLQEDLKLEKKKNEALTKRVKRRSKKIQNMKDMIIDLKQQNLVCDTMEVLSSQFSGLTLSLLQADKKNRDKKEGKRYPDDVKMFASTLYYYSRAAYDYVAQIFSLPNHRLIQEWSSSVDCNPGYLTETTNLLKNLASTNPSYRTGHLIVDEMTLMEKSVYNPSTQQYEGHVDYGTGRINDQLATDALVIMVVGSTGYWKYPISYAFTRKVTASALSDLIINCITMLHDVGINVLSVTSDAYSSMWSAMKKLGCDLKYPNTDVTFPHPCVENQKIYYIPDPPHMLKLTRNDLSENREFKGPFTNLPIQWKFIHNLYHYQDQIGIKAGNKLGLNHILWQSHKMNVKYAAQTLSRSVADAIDFCREELKMTEFQGSQETTNFIRLIDTMFDICNVRHIDGKGNKAPLTKQNIEMKIKVIENGVTYLSLLKDIEGNTLANHPQKRGIYGLAIAATSIMNMSKRLLNELDFKYFLPYKCCQDNLELFFNKIRRCGGWNPNPTTVQFKSAIKKLILRNEVQASRTGNCLPSEKIAKFTVGVDFKTKRRHQNISDNEINIEEPPSKKSFPQEQEDVEEFDLEEFSPSEDLTFLKNSSACIAGWVTRKVGKTMKCDVCNTSLENSPLDAAPEEDLRLINKKNRGNRLKIPSNSVLKITRQIDKELRPLFIRKNLPTSHEIKLIPLTVTRKLLQENLFPGIPSQHILETLREKEVSHQSLLIKYIIQYYLQVRLGNRAKEFNLKVALKGQPSRRHQLHKLSCFMHI